MKLLCKIKFGSHLYGTNTEDSDIDWKGVFLPSKRDILLGRIPKTSNSVRPNDNRKNLPGEEDSEYYSLHHFMKLAMQGQTVAIDMLFAPSCLTTLGEAGHIWEYIVENRYLLLSKNMNAFVGYARAQAAKYSLKGERLNGLREFRETLAKYDQTECLREAWNDLKYDDERINPNGIKELQIGGKWFGETTSIGNVEASINKLIRKYGNRTLMAAKDGGIDWKALSHAVRISYELEDLLVTGKIEFPLSDRKAILDVKLGKYNLESVQQAIDSSLNRIEDLMSKSTLPDKVDVKFWENKMIQWLESIFR